ncbi:MAG: hypothetical protein GX663_11275 [Clostridiales bacterium]|nr:hypothetical protein [Clostridiales bacterium]
MKLLVKIAVLCAFISLLGFPAKVIAEPLKIVPKEEIKVYAFKKVLETWGSKQWDPFDRIISKESINWTVTDYHYPESKKSSAYGLCGTLIKTHKIDVDGFDVYAQVDWCINYIYERYETPQKAWQFHIKNNWF